jgi:hypothetical protein
MVRPRSLGGANIDEAVAVPAAPQPDDSDPELVDSSGSLAAEMFTASSREVRGGDASVRRRSSPPDNQRRQGWLLCSPISSAADGRLVSASRGSGSAASAGQTAARRPHAITIAGPMNHLWSSARSACPRSMTVPGLADCDDGFAGLLPGEARELRLRRTAPKQRHCDLGVGIDQCVSSQLCRGDRVPSRHRLPQLGRPGGTPASHLCSRRLQSRGQRRRLCSSTIKTPPGRSAAQSSPRTCSRAGMCMSTSRAWTKSNSSQGSSSLTKSV